jgi:hypothetical protein
MHRKICFRFVFERITFRIGPVHSSKFFRSLLKLLTWILIIRSFMRLQTLPYIYEQRERIQKC